MFGWLKTLASRIRGLLSIHRLEEEFQQELEAHLSLLTEENMRRGMAPEEARRAARLRLGGHTQLRETHRELWGLPALETFLQDIRYGVRMLRRSPGLTAVAVLTLAVAIGPNSALFSAVDHLLLAPPQIQGITRIFCLYLRTDRAEVWAVPSYPDLLDYRTQAGDLVSFAAESKKGAVLDFADQREIVFMNPVTENYFPLLGVKAAAGRTLLETDEHFDGPPPAVISYPLWRRLFGGARDTVGRTFFLNGRAFYVAGIMPRGFRGPGLSVLPVDLWIPFSADSEERGELKQRGSKGIVTLVRLRDGVDQARAEAVLTTIARRLAAQYPDTNKGETAVLEPAEDKGLLGIIVLSLAGLVLVIACANIAGIGVARGEARRQEFAIRVAMGASRGRLVRQLITETLLLSLMGAAVGLLLALWLIRAIPSLQPLTIFSLDYDLRVDTRVLLYTLLLAFLTTLAAGLAPSLQISRTDLVPALKGEAPAMGRRFRFRGALVIAQVAVSLFLMVGAGLLVRSYVQTQRIRPGFDPGRNVLTAMLSATTEDTAVEFPQIAEKMRSLPGVLRVSFANSLPLSGSEESSKKIFIPGLTPEPVDVGWKAVGAGYFTIMGTRLLRGRDFNRDDPTGSIVVNETMARQLWGSPNAAMDKAFHLEGIDCRVLGVAENGKYIRLRESPMPFMFMAAPLGKRGEGTLLIETATPPMAMAGTIRKAIHDTQPDTLILSLTTLRQHMRIPLFAERMAAGFLGVIAALGMFLAGVGLCGLVSYSVTRRTHEIGVRMAMGAGPASIVSLVLRDVLSRVTIGAAIGLAPALPVARAISPFLYRVSPADPTALAGAVAAMLVVGLLAACVPTWRALRVDPMVALRYE